MLVIFDLDNTLVHLDIKWSLLKEDLIKLAHKKGVSLKGSLSTMMIAHRLAEEGYRAEVNCLYHKYEDPCVKEDRIIIFPRMVGILRKLKERGDKIAVYSGNTHSTIEAALHKSGILNLVDIIVGSDDGYELKPSPQPILSIMRDLGFDADSTIFVGDSESDEMAAKAAGIRFFKVRTLNQFDMDALEKELNLS